MAALLPELGPIGDLRRECRYGSSRRERDVLIARRNLNSAKPLSSLRHNQFLMIEVNHENLGTYLPRRIDRGCRS